MNGQRNAPFLLRGRWSKEYFFRMEFISLSSAQEFDIQMSFDNDGEITLFIYDSVMKKNFRLTGNLFTYK
ncbi:MAG: hypothetical protein KAU17_14925 [Spirochaetales bacterium]|nr:hypothetical protein [Spirochaetales bacterium]